MEKQCVICDKTFSVKPSHYKKLICCSRECSKKYPLYKVIYRVESEINETLDTYLQREYGMNERSYRDICNELKINNRTIAKLLELYNIEIRRGSEAIKTQWKNNPQRRMLSQELFRKNVLPVVFNQHPNRLSDKEIIERTINTDFIYVGRVGKNKVKIRCKKCDSEYVKTPDYLIENEQCFECLEISKGERLIKSFLESQKIDFQQQVKFDDCRNVNLLPFDFGVYSNNELLFLIEYDGKQHFNPECDFGSSSNFESIRKNDTIKTIYCIEKGIPLLRINYKQNVNELLINIIKMVI